ncbi:Phosphoserine aminotransferase [Sphingobacterium daejeonense]|nr:Phosphoserine aminotransferase [Sphingobacterium daejeonense]
MKHNFGAGPCILPKEVFEEASRAVIDFNGTGLSILEISHRSKEFEEVIAETESLVRELLNVPAGYSVLFLQGGASQQFAMVPMNLLPEGGFASYLDTGVWATKAAKEAKKSARLILLHHPVIKIIPTFQRISLSLRIQAIFIILLTIPFMVLKFFINQIHRFLQ